MVIREVQDMHTIGQLAGQHVKDIAQQCFFLSEI